MEELVKKINSKLEKQHLSATTLLGRFKVIDENSRKVTRYTDPTYAPFYYYLGCEIKPRSLVEIGFKIGLISGSFLIGCKTVEKFLAFQQSDEDKYYSPRLGSGNIKKCYKNKFDIYIGEITDEEFKNKLIGNKWDLLVINEETSYDRYMAYLEFFWKYINQEGFICMDYLNYNKYAKKAFEDFCKLKNRSPVRFKSKYGVGLIER